MHSRFYDTDLTNAAWAWIAPVLPAARPGGRPPPPTFVPSSTDASTHTGLRDRALLGVLAYTFARIGAVVNLKVEDYYPSGKRFLLRFKEKGGKEKELPVHHKLEELLDEYLKASGLEKEPESPLFPASIGKTGKLSRRPLVRTDAADMLKRRLKQAGLPAHYSPHSFRATGITNF